MSDFRSQEAGATNARAFTLVAKASGSPITSGTVNWYLKCVTGANAGKWWRDSDQTWQLAETANAMTHQVDGHWTRALAATPWLDGDLDLEYAKESGDLHVPVSRMLKVEYTPSADGSRRVDLGKYLGSAVAALVNGLVPVSVADWRGSTPSTLVGGKVQVDVAAMETDVFTAAALASDAVAEIQSGLSTLDGAAARAALGLATANLDAQLAVLMPAGDVIVGAYAAGQDPATLVLDAVDGAETGLSVREAVRVMLAALAGVLSGAGTTTVTIRNVGDTKDRIIGTVDSSGNRSAVVVDGS